jgi:transcriptional regulator with XRE-family HTH domain
MATVDDTLAWNNSAATPPQPQRPSTTPATRLHRIATVRQEQGVSLRTAARQMRKDMPTVRLQENEMSDLKISDLRAWQEVLEVPLSDLLEDPSPALSRPVLDRARLVRLMKTAAAIGELAESKRVQRLTSMLVDQLVEIMPELREVSAWHTVGQRRSLDEIGRAGERCVSDDWFRSSSYDD